VQKITPMLWFDTQAEEAAEFYTSVFPNSKITEITRSTEANVMAEGTVLVVAFELDGQAFSALNGGPRFQFNESVSLVVDCEDQEEVDYYWSALLADGGSEVACGWLKDRYGFSWQVTPRRLVELIADPDKDRANRAMAAMMQMVKIDIETLEKAVAG
jgi:predicted 3-demethylubiquinone-9 3-methyltransferase (glyoxalase superfamily)